MIQNYFKCKSFLFFRWNWFFFRFDCDSEGVICVDELKFILSNLPVKVSTQEIEEMIKAADIDGDGKIDFQEFRKMIGQ